MKIRNKAKLSGFTLIELLVVITILGILMGIVIPQVIGIFSGSEKTQMQAVLRSWVTQLQQYKSFYGYYPPFLYEAEEEGQAIVLEDHQEQFIYALKGMQKTDSGWSASEDEELRAQNRSAREFHPFSEDEFSEDGNLRSSKFIMILVDHDGDGAIRVADQVVDKIMDSAKKEYDEEEIEKAAARRNQMKLINDEVAIFILEDEESDLKNVFSWNLEKYFE